MPVLDASTYVLFCHASICYRGVLYYLHFYTAPGGPSRSQEPSSLRMVPYLTCSISAGRDHLSLAAWMMLSPRNDLPVHLRRRIWLKQFCLETLEHISRNLAKSDAHRQDPKPIPSRSRLHKSQRPRHVQNIHDTGMIRWCAQ